MNKNKKTVWILIAAIIFVVFAVLFMFLGNISSMSSGKIRKTDSTKMPEANGTTELITDGIVLEQTYINTTDSISRIGIVLTRKTYYEGIDLTIELWKGNELLAAKSMDVMYVEDEHRTFLEMPGTISGLKNQELILKIYSKDEKNTGLVVMMQSNKKSTFKYGNQTINGTLCFSVEE